jgi:ABC-type thiamine transport system substrate-binding protein
MINRQRKRAENILRCNKNVTILRLLKAEKVKIKKINEEIKFTKDPEFITYEKGYFQVLNGISKDQGMKIEIEDLMASLQSAHISYIDFHNQLDNILIKITAINTANN